LKCGAGEGVEDLLDRSCEKRRSVTQAKGENNVLRAVKRREANWLDTSGVVTALWYTALKERWRER